MAVLGRAAWQFPSFEFLHEHGLGLLAVGRLVSSKVLELCSVRDPIRVHAIRQRFSLLGERWSLRARQDLEKKEEIANRDAQIQSIRAESAGLEAQSRSTRHASNRWKTMQRKSHADLPSTAVEGTSRSARRSGTCRTSKCKKPKRTGTGLHVQYPVLLGIKLIISGEPDTPGNLYRVLRPVEAALAVGMQASWIRLGDPPARSHEIADADLIVLWRVASGRRNSSALEPARHAGTRLAFDIDDLLIDPDQVRDDVIDGIVPAI